MSRRLLLVVCVGLAACSDSAPTNHPVATGVVNELPENLQTPSSSCEEPADLPADPVVVLSRTPYKKAHFQDVAYEAGRDLVYVAGLPGLIIYQDTGAEPVMIARYPPLPDDGSKKNNRDYQHLEIVSDTLVALTNRGVQHPGQMGVHLIDTTDPGEPQMWPLVTVPAAAGMAASGETLYVASHDGALYGVDLTDLDRAHETPRLMLDGLGHPWAVVIAEDRAYIADNALGVVTADISDPQGATLVSVTPSSGGPQDLAIGGSKLYVASGSVGVEVFDLGDPDAPAPLATIDIGGPVISVAVQGSLLYTADHAGVGVIDVSDPSNPAPLGFEATPSWAMRVAAHDDRVWLADWNALTVLRADDAILAPAAYVDREALHLVGGTTQTTFEVMNRGAAPLLIHGVTVEDARLKIGFEALTVPPGQAVRGHAYVDTALEDLRSAVCIETNDPDQPLMELTVASSSTGSSVRVGDLAPDFSLPDLEGQLHTLSEQRGRPVVLCYFATW